MLSRVFWSTSANDVFQLTLVNVVSWMMPPRIFSVDFGREYFLVDVFQSFSTNIDWWIFRPTLVEVIFGQRQLGFCFSRCLLRPFFGQHRLGFLVDIVHGYFFQSTLVRAIFWPMSTKKYHRLTSSKKPLVDVDKKLASSNNRLKNPRWCQSK